MNKPLAAGAAKLTPPWQVLAAEAASNFGSMLSRLALPFLATLALQATPWQMGLLLVADVLAGAAAALWLGAWVERRGKRGVMLACDGARALLLGLLALAVWKDQVSMALLLTVAAASAVCTMAFELARSAWMAQQVAQTQLTVANARLAMATSLSETAAFALGGWLYQLWGAVLALLLDALSYLVSAGCLRGLREASGSTAGTATPTDHPATQAASQAPSQPATQPATPHPGALVAAGAEARAGLRVLWAHPALRTLALLDVLLASSFSLAGTSYMIHVARDVGFDPGVLGLVFATGALGALLGAAVAPWLGTRLGAGRAIALGLLLGAVGAACTPLATQAGAVGLALLVVQQIVGDTGVTLHQVHERTLRQTLAPTAWVARVDAAMRFLSQLATLAGALGGGVLATALGARAALWLAAATLLLAAVVAWRGLPEPAAA